jgi:hypothetical protein
MERQANPKGSISVNINASEIFTTSDNTGDDDEYYYDGNHFLVNIYLDLNCL